MKILRPLILSISALVLISAGCSKHRPLPTERLDLVSRFFRSVRHGDFEAAAQQGRKIYDLDHNNGFMLHLITIHESNVFLRKAQKALNAGDLESALRIMDAGCRRYPENRTLNMYRTRVFQLRNAKKLLRDMARAQSSAAMSASLTAATTGMGTNMSPRLAAYFRSYEARIAKVAERERREEKKAEAILESHKKKDQAPPSEEPKAATATPSTSPQTPPPQITVPPEPEIVVPDARKAAEPLK